MIDTHVHLNDKAFNKNLNEIIQGALDNGINKMIVIGYNYKSSLKAIEIANKYPSCYAMVGLQPMDVDKESDKELNWIKEMIKKPKVVGIGEIGIDLYWTKETKDLQIYFFKKQLEIARENNLPVSIHAREATEITYQILKNSNTRGVIHCYSGSLEMAKQFTNLGYYLGIGGVLTFKNAKVKDVVKVIDLKYLVSETDAPYLAPFPHRGEMNKPEYIKIIVNEIANLKDVTLKEAEMQIDKNVKEMFGI